MRSLSAAAAGLMFSAFVGIAAPASAAIVTLTDVVNGPVTVFSGPGNDYTYTHTLSPFNPGTDTILTGTLTIQVSNPSNGGNFQVQFDSGTFVNEGPIPASPTSYTFNVNGTPYGGVNLLTDLQADGQLQVTVRLVGGGTPGTESFVFDKSTLEVRVETPNAIPEPASLFLIGSGLLGFAVVRRACRRKLDA